MEQQQQQMAQTMTTTVRHQQRQQPLMAMDLQWQQGVDRRLSELERATGTIEVAVARVESSMPSRKDVEDAARSRLDVATYTVAHSALEGRVARLETNPARMIAWLGVAFGAIGCATNALLIGTTLIGAIFWLATHAAH